MLDPDVLREGLIPAHAGKTSPQRLQVFIPGAHPRSRGENNERVEYRQGISGSSPLTRGKPWFRWIWCALVGLIPAHAGKTMTAIDARACNGAHPRSRGENGFIQVTSPANEGSSPLTRGKLSQRTLSTRSGGLIPAHAGKTTLWTATRSPVRAHPRSRGENSVIFLFFSSARGSSPLTRGKPCDHDVGRANVRLIPAHAGKTEHPLPDQQMRGAHPRSRGENRAGDVLHAPLWGSSPLTRGKPER